MPVMAKDLLLVEAEWRPANWDDFFEGSMLRNQPTGLERDAAIGLMTGSAELAEAASEVVETRFRSLSVMLAALGENAAESPGLTPIPFTLWKMENVGGDRTAIVFDGGEPLYTVSEVAAYFRVNERTIRGWVADPSGEGLRAVKRKNGTVRITASALKDFMARLQTPAEPVPIAPAQVQVGRAGVVIGVGSEARVITSVRSRKKRPRRA